MLAPQNSCSGTPPALGLTEAELGKDRLRDGVREEIQELASRSQVLSPSDYTCFLEDRLVPISGNELWVSALQERIGSQHRVGIAAIEEFQGLTDVFSINNPGFDLLPQSGVLESLLRRRP